MEDKTMVNKEKYTAVELEIIKFDAEDVITTSNPDYPSFPSTDNETPFEPV